MSGISLKRTSLAKVFILPASVMVRSTDTTKRSVTAIACQACDSSATSDCQITGLAISERVPTAVATTRPSSLTAALRCSSSSWRHCRSRVTAAGRRVGAAGCRRRRCSGVVCHASVVHACFLAGDVPMPRRPSGASERGRKLTGVYTTANGVYAFPLLSLLLHSGAIARPYGEPVEIVTGPVPAQSPFIPLDAKIVVGAVAPASPDPTAGRPRARSARCPRRRSPP